MKENERVFKKHIEKGFFELDKNGNIKRCKKYEANFGRKRKIVNCTPKLITRKVKEYIQLTITINDRLWCVYAHRILWIYFNGEIPPNLEIHHENTIRSDNSLTNLELVTHSENSIYAKKFRNNK